MVGVADHKQLARSSRNDYGVVSAMKTNRHSKGMEREGGAGLEGVLREDRSEEVTPSGHLSEPWAV